MTGKHVMVTGCTADLGQAGAIAIAEMGASIALVCRSRDKGQAVRAEIEPTTGRKDCDLYVDDMSSLADIRAITAEFLATGKPLDVLFNNAGVGMSTRETIQNGFEDTHHSLKTKRSVKSPRWAH
jgi:NAD(P)-dependent dehydrogenase (short-subunit alcohol dehydrogenase family)